jgi:hypothetical protein
VNILIALTGSGSFQTFRLELLKIRLCVCSSFQFLLIRPAISKAIKKTA